MPTLDSVSEQALTSLAILTVNWDRGHDVIESFVPLVSECLSLDPPRGGWGLSGVDARVTS
jgi:hypothetical protein